jgi:hypothetical protein
VLPEPVLPGVVVIDDALALKYDAIPTDILIEFSTCNGHVGAVVPIPKFVLIEDVIIL